MPSNRLLHPANVLPLGIAGVVAVGLLLPTFAVGPLGASPRRAQPAGPLPILAGPDQTCLAGDDFEDNALHGWTSQSTSVFELRAGGPPGSRYYVHAKDGSGASTVNAPQPYLGDLIARTGGCGTFCFQVNLFNDGEPGSPGVGANFYLYSGTTVAQFLAFQISEPGGPNPGWHRVCAPVRLAAGDALPSGPDGQWRVNGTTGGAAAVAAWNAIVRNVTAVRLPVDWGSSSQNEEVGFDNFCLSAATCPTPTGATPTPGPPEPPSWPSGHPPGVPLHNLPQEPNLNPPVGGQGGSSSSGVPLVPEPCGGGCSGPESLLAIPRPTISPWPRPRPRPYPGAGGTWSVDSGRGSGQSPWQLPHYSWGSGATVNARSGELVVAETDLTVAGRGMDLTVSRRYRSGITYNGPFGRNWETDINPRLVEISATMAGPYGTALGQPLAAGDVLRMDGTGRVDVYKRQPDASYRAPDGFYTRLDRSPEGMYFERDRSGGLAMYSIADADGIARLTSVQDRHGNGLRYDGYEGRLTPTRIFDSLGRAITFDHDASDRITAVTDFAGRRWAYSYDANGDLVAVTSPAVTGTVNGNDFPTGKTTRYAYAASVTDTLRAHNLLAITAPNEVASGGPPRVRVGYDGQDRVTRFTTGGTNASGIPAGGTVSYAYATLTPPGRPGINAALYETVVTDANGNQRTYQFNRAGNIVALSAATNRDINPQDSAAYVTAYEYSAEGRLLRTELPEGNVVRHQYDDANPDPLQRGNLLATVREADADRGGEQATLRTAYAYDPIYNRVRAVTDPRGNDPSYQPPNGGAAAPARYTTTYVYDYQEGDNAAALAAALGQTEAAVRAKLSAAGVPMNLGDVNGDGRTDLVAGDLVRVERPTVNLPPESKLSEDFGPQQPSFELYGYNDRGQLRFAMDAEGNLTRYEYHPENDPDGDGRDLVAGAGSGPFGFLRAEVRDAGENPPFVDLTPRPEVTATPGLPSFATATPRPERPAGIYLPIAYKGVPVDGDRVQARPERAADAAPGQGPDDSARSNEVIAASARSGRPAQEPIEPPPPPWRNLEGPRFFQNLRTEYGYDRAGYVTWVRNPRGVRTDFAVNAVGQVQEVVRAADVQEALNNEKEPNWPACRDLTLVECARGMVALAYRSRYTYDANDNVVKVEEESREALDPTLAGPWVWAASTYDILDQTVAEEQSLGPAMAVRWAYRYDRNGNRVLTLSPLALAPPGAADRQPEHLVSAVYDERDGLASESAGGVTEQFRALAAHADIPELTTLPAGRERSTTTYRYNGNGALVAVTDAMDNSGDGRPETSTTLYDGFDRPVSTVDGLGNQSLTRYDPAGNAVRVSRYGPVGGASPTGDGAATFAQPLTEAAITQPLLARAEARHDERNRAYEQRANLFVSPGVDLTRPAILAEGPEHAPGDGWAVMRTEQDRKGRVVYRWEDDGDRWSQTYDGVDRPVWVRDPVGNETQHGYDQAGNEVRTVVIEVSREGEVATGKVPELRQRFTTLRQYDALDRLIREVDDLGRASRWRYDSRGQEVEATDAQHSNTDADLIADPLGLYPGQGQPPTGRINRPGNATLSHHDGLGRLVKREFPLRMRGQGANALDPANPANPDGLVTLGTTWDDAGRVVAQTDDTGQVTRTAYDAQDRPIRRTLADGTVYATVYDLDGHVTRSTDPNGSVIARQVDGLGRVTGVEVTPGTGVVGSTRLGWQYDGLGRLRQATDENNPPTTADDIVIGLAYDSLGRVLEERQGGVAVSSRWSGAGDRLALVFPNGRTLQFSHDGAGLLNTIAEQPAGGNLTVLADYDFAGAGRQIERRLGNGSAWTMLNDDRTAAGGYDAAGQLVRARHLAPGGRLLAGFGHGYNRAGVPRFEDKLHDPANGEMYPYDSLGRMVDYRRGRLNAAGDGLTAPSPNAMPRQTWRLDGAGNWAETSRSVAGAMQAEMRQHSAIHAVTRAGDQTLVYDANGNLTDDGTRLYTWDAFNRLRRVFRKASGAEIAVYAYDALGRRAGKIVSNSAALDGIVRTYSDGAREIEERDGASRVFRQMVYGAGLDEPVLMDLDLDGDGQVTGGADRRVFFHQNAQDSVFALTDAGGQAVEGYQYDPYGRPIVYTPGPNGALDWGGDDVVTPGGASPLANPYLYTGRRWEPETGLYYYRARYMSPVLGRFISQDPLGAWGSPNLGSAFAYVANMPQGATDPSGLAQNGASVVKECIKACYDAGGKSYMHSCVNKTDLALEICRLEVYQQVRSCLVDCFEAYLGTMSVSKGGPAGAFAGQPMPNSPCPPTNPEPPGIGIDEEGVSTKMMATGKGTPNITIGIAKPPGVVTCKTVTTWEVIGKGFDGPVFGWVSRRVCDGAL